jgi:Cohesin domain/Bacterial Ig-like domain
MFYQRFLPTIFLSLVIFLVAPLVSLAATLSISPSTGVYSAGATFTARLVVNTSGQSINAAEGTIKFNPQELTVVSVDRSNSIFNLWVTEPAFSNTAGTITFSGGMPSGYKGAAGSIFNITFRTKNAGTAKVTMSGGAVLANDGLGSNVLSAMNGGTFTIQALSISPEPEEIEYVAPANTPALPKVTSATHPDSEKWYQVKNASLNWELPSGVISVRTLLDSNSSSIPTKVYEDPIKSITLEDLPEGVSFFHVQFKNADGWGKVAHYRLATDSQKPTKFEISLPQNADLANPTQTLSLKAEDETSGVSRYMIKVNSDEPYEYIDEADSKVVTLPSLLPGYHSVIIEGFDKAGNSLISTFSFSILAFDKPVFTEYPSEINEEVIPVVRGTTRPGAEVTVTVSKSGAEPTIYSLTADSAGVFTLIPNGTFSSGVYELTARAKDQFGAQSEISETIKIAVQQPGYVQVGTFLINVLSVIVPLIGLLALLVLSVWFLVIYLKRFRSRVSVESKEAVAMLDREFGNLEQVLRREKELLTNAHKTKKLTKVEEDMFTSLNMTIKSAQMRIMKEVVDVEKLVQKKK